MLLDHCPPEVLSDLALRDLLMQTITVSFDGSKNFRVAERALLTFRSDGVINTLRQHHDWCVPWLVPKLLHAATEHWNQSVLKMLGTALAVLDEMDAANFEALLGAERTAQVSLGCLSAFAGLSRVAVYACAASMGCRGSICTILSRVSECIYVHDS